MYRRQLRLSLSELYLQVGAALAREERWEEATDAFGRALKEGGDLAQEDVLEDLVHAADGAEARDLAVRARLELSLVRPDRAFELVRRAAKLVDDDVAAALGEWIVEVWRPRLQERRIDGAASFEAAVLAGRVALRSGDEGNALALFEEATTAAADRGAGAARTIIEAEDAGTADEPNHWLRARIYEAFGVSERAIDEVVAALDAAEAIDHEVEMLEFQVRHLRATSRDAEAADALVALGRRLDMQTEHARAVEAYAEATDVNSGDAMAWWYLGDSRRLAAVVGIAGPADLGQLRRARKDLDAGLRIRTPSSTETWVYWSAALIEEALADKETDADDLLYEAARCVEQAVAIEPGTAELWAILVRHYRALGAPATAMGALVQAEELDRTHEDVRIARMLTLAELGIDGAFEAIDAYDEDQRSSSWWSASVRGFVLLYQGRYEEAEASFGPRLREEEHDAWTLSYRALARTLTGDAEGARADASKVAGLSGAVEPSLTNVEARAWSALVLGDLATARRVFEEYMTTTWVDPVEMRLGLACVERLEGDLARATALWTEAAERAIYPRHAAAGTVVLDILERLGAEVDRAELMSPFLQAAERVSARDFGTAEALGELAAVERASSPTDARWLTAVAARARVLATERRWVEAADTYELLLPYGGPGSHSVFSPAKSAMVAALVSETSDAIDAGDVERVERSHRRLAALGEATESMLPIVIAAAHRVGGRHEAALEALELLASGTAEEDSNVVPAWRVSADILVDLGRPADAVSYYQRALKALPEIDVEQRAAVETRIGVAAAAVDDPVGALAHMRTALDVMRPQEGRTRAAETVMDNARGQLVAGPPALLPMTLRALIEDREEKRGQRRRLASARFQGLRGDAGGLRGPVPLMLEADEAVFPHGGASEGVAELIEESIPAMRARILKATGVLVPGVRVSASAALPDRAFTVLLHDVPYPGGHAPADARLCTDAEACDKLGIEGEPLANAWLGPRAALWLDPPNTREADQARLPLLGTYEAMLWNLEGVVRVHLHRLVGLAEVDYMVEEWRTQHASARSDPVAVALPDQRARIGFAAIVRRLVAERISVADVEGLLEVFSEVRSQPDAIEQAVATMRSEAPEMASRQLESSPA